VDVLTPVCSTHAPVLDEISFKTSKQHSFKRQIRNYNAADIEGLADEMNITNWNDLVFNSDNITDCSKNGGGSLALVKFDMDLAILHYFQGGISLFKSSELSLFLYFSFVFLTKSITSFLISLKTNSNDQDCL
jgi:hypothetical protein